MGALKRELLHLWSEVAQSVLPPSEAHLQRKKQTQITAPTMYKDQCFK